MQKSESMTTRLSRRSALIATTLAAVFVGGVASGPAEASQFQVYRNSGATCATAFCNLFIAAIPAGKRLLVNGTTCTFSTGNGGGKLTVAALTILNGANQTTFVHYLVPQLTADTGTSTFFAANNSIPFIVPAGHKLQVSTSFASTGVNVACSVVGELLP